MQITSNPNETKLYKDASEINIPFPTGKYNKLLKKLNISERDDHSDILIKKVFINSIKLFLIGNLSQDELSNIANHLWYSRKERFDELGSTLYECSELSFYIRRIYAPEKLDYHGNFIQFMTTIMEYYEKNKLLLEE